MLFVSRAASLQRKFIWRDIYACNTRKREEESCGERASTRLHLCDDASKKKKQKKNCSRGKGNKNNNKNAFSLPRSQIAECRPHHHNRIATKRNKKHSSELYVFVHRREMKCAHRIVEKLKIFFFIFQNFKSN